MSMFRNCAVLLSLRQRTNGHGLDEMIECTGRQSHLVCAGHCQSKCTGWSAQAGAASGGACRDPANQPIRSGVSTRHPR
jgi:hypothetical protein